MNIAMLGCRGIPSKYGGVEKVVEEISSRLVKKGHQVSVICRSHYTPKMRKYNGVDIIRLPTINQKHLEMIIHTFFSTLYLFFKKYDIIHVHSVDPALLTPILRLKHKVVATSHGQAYRREKWGRIAKSLSKLAENVYIKSADCCTAVSKTLVNYYSHRYRRAPEYIPNGIDFRAQEDVNLIKNFGLESNKYLLFVGRLIPTKGPKILIEAYKKIKSDLNLVLVGGSSHTDEYEKSLKKESVGLEKLWNRQ